MKNLWNEGTATVGLWCSLADPAVLELAARAGYDYVTVDLQHGFNTWTSLVGTLRALRQTPTTVLVRVPSTDPAGIMRALDLGADGIVVPMVEDAETARSIVEACRYPAVPDTGGHLDRSATGGRSYGPIWADHDGPTDLAAANREVICIVQIETARGFENAHEIASTPGIDVVYVGPYDLAYSTGHGGATYRNDPKVAAMIQRVMDVAAETGVVAGMHCDGPEMVAHWRARGARMLTSALDTKIGRAHV